MTLHRMSLAAVGLAVVAGAAYVSQATEESAGTRMTAAATTFLDSLKPEQRTRATFAFDDKERTNYHFVPLQDKDRKPTRKGLRLEEMTADQKKAALKLVEAGTSAAGYTKATTIMSLESLLNELEMGKGPVRNPEWYFFSVFGKPEKTGKWGWRVEGHHLSLNFTLDGGAVVSATPAIFASNPAEVKAGDKKGLRALPEAEEPVRELLEALTDEQRKTALQTKQFPEIEQATAVPKVGDPVGLPAAKMTEKQQALLLKVIEAYARRMPADVARAEMDRVKKGGVDKIHFGYFRDEKAAGKPYTYRVQGPTFVIEFLNVQADAAKNPANHIHSGWRTLTGDFGIPR